MTKLTDGGRIANGYMDERRDCIVRALANVADIPYYQAHDLFKWGGRRKRCASDILETLHEVNVVGTSCRMRLSQFLAENKTGSFIVLKRGHAFVVKNGIICLF